MTDHPEPQEAETQQPKTPDQVQSEGGLTGTPEAEPSEEAGGLTQAQHPEEFEDTETESHSADHLDDDALPDDPDPDPEDEG